MPLFDRDTLQVYDSSFDDEPLLIDSQFESGSNADGYSLTFVKHYQIDAADFVALCLQQPLKGHLFGIDLNGLRVWYQVNQVRIDRDGSQRQLLRHNAPDGTVPYIQIINVKVSIDLTSISDPDKTDEYVSPLALPPYNLKCGTELLEQSVTHFYNTGTAQGGTPELQEFVNTAGVPLQASTTRPLLRVSFSFNVAEVVLADVYRYIGCVNSEPLTICGLDFDRYQVKLESLNMEACKEVHETTLANGTTVEETTNYIRVDVSLLIDPQTFERQYLNVGTHIVQDGGLHRLWCGTLNWKDNEAIQQSGGGSQGSQQGQQPTPSNPSDSGGTEIAQGGEQGGAGDSGEGDSGAGEPSGPNPTADEGDDPPADDPGDDPGDAPGTDPGAEPGDDPGTDPTVDPGTDPGYDPGYQEPTYDEEQSFGDTYYGTIAQVMRAGLKDPQEVSENMFLNEDGSMIMPFQNGRQVPSFRTGIIEPLVDLNCLHLPTEPPFIWTFEVKPKENDG